MYGIVYPQTRISVVAEKNPRSVERTCNDKMNNRGYVHHFGLTVELDLAEDIARGAINALQKAFTGSRSVYCSSIESRLIADAISRQMGHTQATFVS
jgi:hypothetical protein